jgi:hypothetical protein
VLNAKGNCAEAREMLATAAKNFQEMGIDRDLQQVMAELELLAD